ncbi:DUF945 family protein [Vibrio tapetis]|uniref:DUF945 domain-containing protein n=1 Tax=Vibrio tapetis subsp. tapetis TaxID=1671868 RepID=A0A2N8Z8U6_9VIBR|nr:DUF945 family protein [Vibrio tapetis]SON48312.1 conserved protein of unknown function [Vibrio tapetis subsp. tapetis]
MQQLRKYGAIGGAIVIAAIWPLAVGQIAQKVMTDGIVQLSNSKMSAEVIEYDRGYFSAQAITRFVVTDEALKSQLEKDGIPTQISLTHQISHGLLSIDAKTNTLENPLLAFSLNTNTKLNGNTTFSLNGDPIEFKDKNGGQLNIDRYTSEGSIVLGGESLVRIEVPNTEVEFANGESLQMKKLVLEGKGQKGLGIWLGSQNIQIDGLALDTHDPLNSMSLDQLSYAVNAYQNETGDSLTNTQQLQLKQVELSDVTFDQIDMDFSINGLNSSAFEGLMSLYQQNQVLNDQQIEQAIPLLDSLVESGIRFDLSKLSVASTNGDMAMKWNVEIPKGLANVSQNPTMLINQLTGELSSSTSEKLASTYPMVQEGIDEMMIMEFAEESSNGYALKATLDNGIVTFDTGKQMSLMALFMPLMVNGQ